LSIHYSGTSFKKQKAEDKGRAVGYPGPGALPGDGRTFFVSVGAKRRVNLYFTPLNTTLFPVTSPSF